MQVPFQCVFTDFTNLRNMGLDHLDGTHLRSLIDTLGASGNEVRDKETAGVDSKYCWEKLAVWAAGITFLSCLLQNVLKSGKQSGPSQSPSPKRFTSGITMRKHGCPFQVSTARRDAILTAVEGTAT